MLYSWKEHFGVALIGRQSLCGVGSEAEEQEDHIVLFAQPVHNYLIFYQ